MDEPLYRFLTEVLSQVTVYEACACVNRVYILELTGIDHLAEPCPEPSMTSKVNHVFPYIYTHTVPTTHTDTHTHTHIYRKHYSTIGEEAYT